MVASTQQLHNITAVKKQEGESDTEMYNKSVSFYEYHI